MLVDRNDCVEVSLSPSWRMIAYFESPQIMSNFKIFVSNIVFCNIFSLFPCHQVTFSYGSLGGRQNVLNIPGFNDSYDPSR